MKDDIQYVFNLFNKEAKVFKRYDQITALVLSVMTRYNDLRVQTFKLVPAVGVVTCTEDCQCPF